MSDATKDKMKDDIDEFGDFYFIDIDDSDVRQVTHLAFERLCFKKWAHL